MNKFYLHKQIVKFSEIPVIIIIVINIICMLYFVDMIRYIFTEK